MPLAVPGEGGLASKPALKRSPSDVSIGARSLHHSPSAISRFSENYVPPNQRIDSIFMVSESDDGEGTFDGGSRRGSLQLQQSFGPIAHTGGVHADPIPWYWIALGYVFPGSVSDNMRLTVVKLLPLLINIAWLNFPLSPTPNEKYQSLTLYTAPYSVFYTTFATIFGWAIYNLVLPHPPYLHIAIITTITVGVDVVIKYYMYNNITRELLRYAIPVGSLFSTIPFFGYILVYTWFLPEQLGYKVSSFSASTTTSSSSDDTPRMFGFSARRRNIENHRAHVLGGQRSGSGDSTTTASNNQNNNSGSAAGKRPRSNSSSSTSVAGARVVGGYEGVGSVSSSLSDTDTGGDESSTHKLANTGSGPRQSSHSLHSDSSSTSDSASSDGVRVSARIRGGGGDVESESSSSTPAHKPSTRSRRIKGGGHGSKRRRTHSDANTHTHNNNNNNNNNPSILLSTSSNGGGSHNAAASVASLTSLAVDVPLAHTEYSYYTNTYSYSADSLSHSSTTTATTATGSVAHTPLTGQRSFSANQRGSSAGSSRLNHGGGSGTAQSRESALAVWREGGTRRRDPLDESRSSVSGVQLSLQPTGVSRTSVGGGGGGGGGGRGRGREHYNNTKLTPAQMRASGSSAAATRGLVNSGSNEDSRGNADKLKPTDDGSIPGRITTPRVGTRGVRGSSDSGSDSGSGSGSGSGKGESAVGRRRHGNGTRTNSQGSSGRRHHHHHHNNNNNSNNNDDEVYDTKPLPVPVVGSDSELCSTLYSSSYHTVSNSTSTTSSSSSDSRGRVRGKRRGSESGGGARRQHNGRDKPHTHTHTHTHSHSHSHNHSHSHAYDDSSNSHSGTNKQRTFSLDLAAAKSSQAAAVASGNNGETTPLELFSPRDTRKGHMATFVLIILFSAALLVTYVFCQVFTAVAANVSSDGESGSRRQILLVFVFQLSMFILKNGMKFFGGLFGLEHKSAVLPVIFFLNDMFYFSFQRILFLKFSSVATLAVSQVIDVTVELCLYGGRLHIEFYRLQRYIQTALATSAVCGEIVPLPSKRYKAYSRSLVLEFFMRSVADSISLVTFMVGLTILRYNHNAAFYPFEDVDVYRYFTFVLLIGFFICVKVGVVSWVQSRFVGFHGVQLSTVVLKHDRVWVTLIVTAIHIQQDLFLSVNKLNFPPM